MNSELAPLSHRIKYLGWILFCAGIVTGVLFAFFNLVINLPVLAIFSSFMETKYFAVFTTNFTDELTLLLLLGGIFMIVFSKERGEEDSIDISEIFFKIRARSIFRAIFYNTLFLIFSILFIFGQGFFWVLVFNLLSIFVIYLIIFELSKRKAMKS
ncbi:MAG: hypothetical protein AB9922_09755 [Bacteroidales bacterium]